MRNSQNEEIPILVQKAVPAPVAGVVDRQPALLQHRLRLQRHRHRQWRAVAGSRAHQRLCRRRPSVGLRNLLRLRILSTAVCTRGRADFHCH